MFIHNHAENKSILLANANKLAGAKHCSLRECMDAFSEEASPRSWRRGG